MFLINRFHRVISSLEVFLNKDAAGCDAYSYIPTDDEFHQSDGTELDDDRNFMTSDRSSRLMYGNQRSYETWINQRMSHRTDLELRKQ